MFSGDFFLPIHYYVLQVTVFVMKSLFVNLFKTSLVVIDSSSTALFYNQIPTPGEYQVIPDFPFADITPSDNSLYPVQVKLIEGTCAHVSYADGTERVFSIQSKQGTFFTVEFPLKSLTVSYPLFSDRILVITQKALSVLFELSSGKNKQLFSRAYYSLYVSHEGERSTIEMDSKSYYCFKRERHTQGNFGIREVFFK